MNKLILFLSIFLLFSEIASAKKVKFQVKFDINNLALDFTGGYVEGDFQKLLGQTDDWISNGNPMIKNPIDTLLYTLVLDLPAHRAYRFLYLRNSQDYAIEDVPEEAESVSAHRWIYVDSTANDTLVIPPVVYNENAPFGKNLLRFKVDMKNVNSINSKGVHLITNLSGWNASTYYMHKLDTYYHEIITYLDTNIHSISYRFVNGNDTSLSETVPITCATGKNRTATIQNHKVLSPVCYAKCDSICLKTSSIEEFQLNQISISPNPFKDFTNIKLNSGAQTVEIYNSNGKIIYNQKEIHSEHLIFEKQNLIEGIYFLKVIYQDKSIQNSKLIIQ